MSKDAETAVAPTRAPLQAMRAAAVSSRIGIGRSAFLAMVKDGKFPQPARYGQRCSVWSSWEVEDWLAARFAERTARATTAH